MKKLLSLCLALLLLCAAVPVSAAHITGAEAVGQLELLGLVSGTGEGFEPDRPATRAEAVVMLLRLLGLEEAAEAAQLPSRFTDGGWADAYLSYAAAQGLVAGLTEDTFGSEQTVSARDFVTMALRALDYQEWKDFFWADSLPFADEIGLTHGEYGAQRFGQQILFDLPEPEFLREDMALIAYTALTLKPKGSSERLIDRLYARGAVSEEALKASRLAGAVNAGRPVYTAAEIYERCSSSVLYIKLYTSEENYQAGNFTYNGTGFLISPDGAALMCYHEMEDCARAVAVTTDGREFEISTVLAYDPLWDYALVRLDNTDREGKAVRFFPYLDLGDSGTISPGDPIFTLSNPLRLRGTLTDGLISHPRRVLEDPDYPVIQITAPTASGSSGGPLLNQYGEAIGVLYASYAEGENINLAFPINEIPLDALTAEGSTVAEVCKLENEKKLAARIHTDETSLTLREGEERSIVVSHDYPGNLRMGFEIGNSNFIRCSWGNYITKQSSNLSIRGLAPGKSVLDLYFVEGGDPDYKLRLTIEVLPAETA